MSNIESSLDDLARAIHSIARGGVEGPGGLEALAMAFGMPNDDMATAVRQGLDGVGVALREGLNEIAEAIRELKDK